MLDIKDNCWIAKSRNMKGEVKNHSISIEQMRIAREIIPAFCAYLEQKNKFEFEVDTLINYVLGHTEDIAGYKSRDGKSVAEKEYPAKRLFDAQNLCYHLSTKKTKDKDSFWVESTATGEMIRPFKWTNKLEYELLKNWRQRIGT